jgi:hypothetical protein
MIKPMESMELENALDELEKCVALILDNDILMYPRIIKNLKNENNETIFLLQWVEDSMTYEICFTENENEIVGYSESSMFLIDDRGEEVQITLLTEKKL